MKAYRIVVFYVAIAGDNREALAGLSGVEQLNLLHRSALLTNPEVSFTILTSPSTDLSGLDFDHQRVDAEVDPSRIMLERTRMQRDFVAGITDTVPLAFLDSDILLRADLSTVFDDDFDIGLTWRPDDSMPFNGGVILANGRDMNAVRSFFDAFLDQYSRESAGQAEWYGDQQVLAALIGLPPSQIASSAGVDRAGARVRFLPCSIYNYSPSARSRILVSLPDEPILFHFKGNSRRLMEPVWRYCLAPERGGYITLVNRLLATIKLRLGKRSYRHRLRGDLRRFTCGDQKTRTWTDRATLATELVARAATTTAMPPYIADIGCGDKKLAIALQTAGIAHNYAGYDLVPQTSDVLPLDLSRDRLPKSCDVAVALGLFEYIADAGAALARVRQDAAWLVVSHSARDLRSNVPTDPVKLGWTTWKTADEFEALLVASGWSVEERRVTPDGRTGLWLCRAA